MIKILLNYILIIKILFLNIFDFEDYLGVLSPFEVGSGEYNIECLF